VDQSFYFHIGKYSLRLKHRDFRSSLNFIQLTPSSSLNAEDLLGVKGTEVGSSCTDFPSRVQENYQFCCFFMGPVGKGDAPNARGNVGVGERGRMRTNDALQGFEL